MKRAIISLLILTMIVMVSGCVAETSSDYAYLDTSSVSSNKIENESNKEQSAAQKAEEERLVSEKAEQERIASEKAEQERVASEKAEQERIASEKAEQERIASEKVEQERIASEKSEQERIASEEAEEQKLTAKQDTSSVDHPKVTGKTVYCTPTGKRYHLDPDRGGKNSREIDLDSAISSGLTPCQKCAK